MAQWLAQESYTFKVAGSSPAGTTHEVIECKTIITAFILQ